MADIVNVLRGVIDQYWQKFDGDTNGQLDKKEARVQNLQNELDQCIANINRIKLDCLPKEKVKELESTIENQQKSI